VGATEVGNDVCLTAVYEYGDETEASHIKHIYTELRTPAGRSLVGRRNRASIDLNKELNLMEYKAM
jgi:hypothetical protein